MQVHMDRAMKAKKSDRIIKSEKEKLCMLIGMAIASDRNTSVNVVEKLEVLRYGH